MGEMKRFLKQNKRDSNAEQKQRNWGWCRLEVEGRNCGIVFRRDKLGKKGNSKIRMFRTHVEIQERDENKR